MGRGGGDGRSPWRTISTTSSAACCGPVRSVRATPGPARLRPRPASTRATAPVSTSAMSPRATALSSRVRVTSTRYWLWLSTSARTAGTVPMSRDHASVERLTATCAARR
ncbi:hypothetical protein DQ239_02215 [Blastococcus sp. TF02-09]|nr:hypothetical protein DQ239_02215 [Blastococcus sp. TF02-9]